MSAATPTQVALYHPDHPGLYGDGIAVHPCGLRVEPATGNVFGATGRIVGSTNPWGYRTVPLPKEWAGHKSLNSLAHRIVWEAVHGPIPDGLEINHKNGVKTDNRIDNLELVTKSENLRHAYAMGLRAPLRGEKSAGAKLTWALVGEIRRRLAQGRESLDSLAEEYGVCRTSIRNIRDYKTWATPRETCRCCTGQGHREARIEGKTYLITCLVCDGGGVTAIVIRGAA